MAGHCGIVHGRGSASASLHQRKQVLFRFLVTFPVHILGYNLYLPDKNLQSPQSSLALLYRKWNCLGALLQGRFPFLCPSDCK